MRLHSPSAQHDANAQLHVNMHRYTSSTEKLYRTRNGFCLYMFACYLQIGPAALHGKQHRRQRASYQAASASAGIQGHITVCENLCTIGCCLHAGYAAQGDFENMVQYSTANGYKPDYLYLMQRMMMDNPEAAVNLAKMVAKQPGPPIDLNTMTDLFLQVCALCTCGSC